VRMKVRYHLTHVCCACACAVVRVRVCGVCGVCANHAAMQGKGGRQ
jgi:hypothetical protein